MPHWLAALWGALWPNVFAPNVWTLAGIAAHLVITLVQRERHHRVSEAAAGQRQAQMKQHVTDMHEGSTGGH